MADDLTRPYGPATTRGNEPGDVSLFAVATALLRGWRRIAAWTVIGMALATVAGLLKPKVYEGSFAFVPQGADAARSTLSALAGTFGIATPTVSPSSQPDFYLALLSSREILTPILVDTFTIAEENGRRVTLLDLLRIAGTSPANRVEHGVPVVASLIQPSIVKNTGIIRVTVRTKWPSVSLKISRALLSAVNDYNVRSRQEQAMIERKFVEGRLADAEDSLRGAEDRLATFLSANRAGVTGAPLLNSAWQRYEREVSSRKAIVTTLMQQLEDVRLREVRDTPVITVFESPIVATTPEPRRRVITVIAGVAAGAAIGMIMTLLSAIVTHRKSLRDPDADEFFGTVAALRRRVPLPRNAERH